MGSVIAIANQKGGVGKTTLATNLAIYLKALDEDLPVIMITAFASVENAIAAMKRGAFDYITKPVRAELVRARVKAHLDSKLARDFLVDQTRTLERIVQQRVAQLAVLQEIDDSLTCGSRNEGAKIPPPCASPPSLAARASMPSSLGVWLCRNGRSFAPESFLVLIKLTGTG